MVALLARLADLDIRPISLPLAVSIKKGQSFYPCECGANVKRPDDDDHHQEQQDSDSRNNANAKRRRSNTAGAAIAGVVRETAKQKKKREKREREQKKKQDEEERKFRERRDKGRLSASQWNRQVDSARERLWRASVIVAGPNGEYIDDGSTSMLSTDDDVSTVGSSAYDVDTFEDARSDSPRDISSFSSALSGRSLSRTGSLSSISLSESSKVKRNDNTKKLTKEQRKKEKEEKKRLKKLEKEEREEKRKTERMGKEKKRRNSLFGSSSGSIATRKQRDKLTSSSSATGNGNPDSITVTINPITAHAKRQQQQMKAKTMVKTKSGKVMTLEEVEREGKKNNWDVSRLFSVRIGGGARTHKQQAQRKASLGAPDASSHIVQRAAQQERELQEAARQLEEERRRFAEERQRFEAERLKVMLMLAQDMEGVKMARDGTPMYPSPANHPLLVPTEPSPIPSFAASQSSFTCLPSIAMLSADALVSEFQLPAASTLATVPLSMAPPTSNSTPSLPSVAGGMYNPSLASMPTSFSLATNPDDTTAELTNDSSVEEATEAVPSSPRKPPSGGVFLPFLVAPRGAGSQQRPVASPRIQREDDAAAELDEKLLDQLKDVNADDEEHEHVKEAETHTSSDDEHGEEEEERSDNDDEDDDDAAITTSEEEVRTKPVGVKERRKITVAPIQGIPDMRELDAQQQCRQLDGSWVTAISPRQREECEEPKAVDSDAAKDVIVRPGMSPSSVADKSKKVSFGGASWTSAESPRRMLEALRAQGASQAEIDRERRRLANVAETASGLEATKAAIATKYEAEIDQLLGKMKQLSDRSSSDDSWGSSSDVSDVDDDEADVTKQEKTLQPHDISSDEEDDGDDSDEENDDEEVVIPEWNRGPPKSLKEMKEYKEFVRARYEAEKRETERMLRRNQREMRSRGITLPSTSTSSPLSNHDPRVSWVI
jgi:hypothetical protein